jgi:hypothetical protein
MQPAKRVSAGLCSVCICQPLSASPHPANSNHRSMLPSRRWLLLHPELKTLLGDRLPTIGRVPATTDRMSIACDNRRLQCVTHYVHKSIACLSVLQSHPIGMRRSDVRMGGRGGWCRERLVPDHEQPSGTLSTSSLVVKHSQARSFILGAHRYRPPAAGPSHAHHVLLLLITLPPPPASSLFLQTLHGLTDRPAPAHTDEG